MDQKEINPEGAKDPFHIRASPYVKVGDEIYTFLYTNAKKEMECGKLNSIEQMRKWIREREKQATTYIRYILWNYFKYNVYPEIIISEEKVDKVLKSGANAVNLADFLIVLESLIDHDFSLSKLTATKGSLNHGYYATDFIYYENNKKIFTQEEFLKDLKFKPYLEAIIQIQSSQQF